MYDPNQRPISQKEAHILMMVQIHYDCFIAKITSLNIFFKMDSTTILAPFLQHNQKLHFLSYIWHQGSKNPKEINKIITHSLPTVFRNSKCQELTAYLKRHGSSNRVPYLMCLIDRLLLWGGSGRWVRSCGQG